MSRPQNALFSAFLAPITSNAALVALAAVSFAATSVWALFCAAITARLNQPRVILLINLVLALLLVYSALSQ